MNFKMIGKQYTSLIEILQALQTQEDCRLYLEKMRWGDKVISPYDSTSKVYKTKRGYRCKNTGKDFNVLTGTVIQGTKIPLIKWILAMWLINSRKQGISSHELSRTIQVTQPTAWLILHKLRFCYEPDYQEKLSGSIELDETFVGGKNRNRHYDKKVPNTQGRAYIDKTPVLGILQRNGEVRTFVIPSVSQKTLTPLIINNVDSKNSFLNMDEYKGYNKIKRIYDHGVVSHGKHQYVNGDIHSNTIEGFWGILKRGIIGVYGHTSRQHLQKYCWEFSHRYNSRKMSESERFYDYLGRIEKRLTYRQLTSYGKKTA